MASGSTWKAPALAKVLAEHSDDEIREALLLLVSQRPSLPGALIEDLSQPPAQRFGGVIKSFFPDKRFGFITCADLEAEFGGDVFLSDQEIGQFTVGSSVTFSVTLNKNGKPQAKLLEASAGYDDQWAAGPPRKVPRVLAPPPAAVRSTARLVAPPPAPRLVAPPPAPSRSPTEGFDDYAGDSLAGDERHYGSIKSFFPEKHFGFIQCEEISASQGCDVFLSDKEIAEFTVGSSVSFAVAFNKQGKPQARDLQPA